MNLEIPHNFVLIVLAMVCLILKSSFHELDPLAYILLLLIDPRQGLSLVRANPPEIKTNSAEVVIGEQK